MSIERLQKILARAGVASRRAAERLITDGRVRVNGAVIRELGSKADLEADTIEVEGFGVLQSQPSVYVALHKPPYVVSTVSDPEGRQTIIQVLEESRAMGKRAFEGELPRLFPVGRLDFDAEGLILLTNDGELANALLHPRYHVPKTYTVKVRGRPGEKQLERLRKGVRLKLPDGRLSKPTRPAQVQVVKHGPSNTWLEITIIEGRHHQIKLMCDAIGHQVSRLIRTEFGAIQLDPLPTGAWRFLTRPEVESLRRWRNAGQKQTDGSAGRAPARKGSGPTHDAEVGGKAGTEKGPAARSGAKPTKKKATATRRRTKASSTSRSAAKSKSGSSHAAAKRSGNTSRVGKTATKKSANRSSTTTRKSASIRRNEGASGAKAPRGSRPSRRPKR